MNKKLLGLILGGCILVLLIVAAFAVDQALAGSLILLGSGGAYAARKVKQRVATIELHDKEEAGRLAATSRESIDDSKVFAESVADGSDNGAGVVQLRHYADDDEWYTTED